MTVRTGVILRTPGEFLDRTPPEARTRELIGLLEAMSWPVYIVCEVDAEASEEA